MNTPEPTSRTIRDSMTAFSAFLAEKAVDSPRLSIELLLGHVLNTDRLGLLVNRNSTLSEEQYDKLKSLILRRAMGEPVAYLTGNKEFYGRDFMVTPNTLIPRPETELLIDTALGEVGSSLPEASITFADLGTGSGCIAVSIAAELPFAKGVAVDKSRQALRVAHHNACTHTVDSHLSFVMGDFTTSLFRPNSFDLIISNPPYVSELEYDDLSNEVRGYEPKSALVPDHPESSGLEHAKRLLPMVYEWLKPGGLFLMEFGWKQGHDVLQMVQDSKCNWLAASILKDLAGRDRALFARRYF